MRPLFMSSLSLTGLSVQFHELGLSSTLSPPAKLSSVALLKASTKWKVWVESTGVPVVSLFKTLPPEPPGPWYQSPWFGAKGQTEGVGVGNPAQDAGVFDR